MLLVAQHHFNHKWFLPHTEYPLKDKQYRRLFTHSVLLSQHVYCVLQIECYPL